MILGFARNRTRDPTNQLPAIVEQMVRRALRTSLDDLYLLGCCLDRIFPVWVVTYSARIR